MTACKHTDAVIGSVADLTVENLKFCTKCGRVAAVDPALPVMMIITNTALLPDVISALARGADL